MAAPSVVGIFCEDIREEKSGQDTIIGVLPDNLNVGSIPGMMPKVCLYVRIHMPKDFDPTTSIALRLRNVDETVIIDKPLDPDLIRSISVKASQSSHPYLGFIQKVVVSPLPLEKEGHLLAEVTIGDEARVCTALNIRLKAPTPT